MGISNSIGSNTFDILLCLGLPWLIKASLTPAEPGHYWVRFQLFICEFSILYYKAKRVAIASLHCER